MPLFRPARSPRSDSPSSPRTLRRHHVRDLEAALGTSIGRTFDVLSRQFRGARDQCSRLERSRR